LGENSWGARVPATVASLVTLALVTIIARRRGWAAGAAAATGEAQRPAGATGEPLAPPGLAAWSFGTSRLPFLFGRTVSTDPYPTLNVAAFWALAPSPWAIAALGVGFLAKGPVVLVPTVLAVVVAAAWARDRRLLASLGPPHGWILFAAIAVPWYAIVIRTP